MLLGGTLIYNKPTELPYEQGGSVGMTQIKYLTTSGMTNGAG